MTPGPDPERAAGGDAVTLREARAAYFAANRLPADGGYAAKWVVIRIGPLPFAFPNTADRRRAVPFHDLHHALTGYATDLAGEAEIGAWELASGCRASRAATVLNLQVMGFVLPRHWGRIRRAFQRGRHSANYYGRDRPCDDALLARSLADARRELRLDRETPPADAADRRAFARWAALGLGTVWGPLIPLAWLAARWLG